MDISFSAFIEGIVSSPILCITVLLTLGVIFVNGWTDAPNAIATCVTTRCMGVRSAILMSAAFNFLGVLVMTQINSSVASTISNTSIPLQPTGALRPGNGIPAIWRRMCAGLPRP